MRILISAYSCETGRGSEGEIGWQVVHELAKRHSVRVITRANLQEVHERSFQTNPKPDSLHFEYFDLPWIFRFYKRKGRFFLVYYYLWQIGVAFRARRMLRKEPTDVLHHLIGGMDWMPAGLALCPGPFIWGPVGSEDTHPAIRKFLPLKSRIKDRARSIVRSLMRNIDIFTRITGARANVILSHTPENLPRRYSNKQTMCTQTGIVESPHMVRPKVDYGRNSPLRLLYAGELKDWKGAEIALRATLQALEAGAEVELTVIGSGPLSDAMQRAASRHPKGFRVKFKGSVPMATLVNDLHQSDAFLYPSFHHGLATVVLQAMLTGLPVICVEGDATGRVVGAEAGITAVLSKDEPPSAGIARAIKELYENEALRQRLAKNARKIALNRYCYGNIACNLEKTYKRIAEVTDEG